MIVTFYFMRPVFTGTAQWHVKFFCFVPHRTCCECLPDGWFTSKHLNFGSLRSRERPSISKSWRSRSHEMLVEMKPFRWLGRDDCGLSQKIYVLRDDLVTGEKSKMFAQLRTLHLMNCEWQKRAVCRFYTEVRMS